MGCGLPPLRKNTVLVVLMYCRPSSRLLTGAFAVGEADEEVVDDDDDGTCVTAADGLMIML